MYAYLHMRAHTYIREYIHICIYIYMYTRPMIVSIIYFHRMRVRATCVLQRVRCSVYYIVYCSECIYSA